MAVVTTLTPTATAAQVLAWGLPVVDLRSPAEFDDDHMPGAVNLPLFDNVERALIGTLYKRSPSTAFDVGVERTRQKISGLVGEICRHTGWRVPEVDLAERVTAMCSDGLASLEGALEPMRIAGPPAGAVAFHCWRGGLRSRSVIAMLRGLGFDGAIGVAGGYKGYRNHVLASLDSWTPGNTVGAGATSVVLRGVTGVGKTLVLHEIERLRPGWTVDLEGLAGHRGSILGMVGTEPCSQKLFDSRLHHRLRSRDPAAPCVIEGESRKVGDAVIPDRVWEALDGGTNLRLTAPLGRRVQVLAEDYLASRASQGQLAAQLPFLEQRLGSRKWSGRLVAMLERGEVRPLIELLLARYYDPRYERSERGRTYAAEFDAADPAEAAAAVVAWIEALPGRRVQR